MRREWGSKEWSIIGAELNGVRGGEDTINTAQDKQTHSSWLIPFVVMLYSALVDGSGAVLQS